MIRTLVALKPQAPATSFEGGRSQKQLIPADKRIPERVGGDVAWLIGPIPVFVIPGARLCEYNHKLNVPSSSKRCKVSDKMSTPLGVLILSLFWSNCDMWWNVSEVQGSC